MQKLLKKLIDDEKKINNKLYSAGTFWKSKSKKTIKELKKKSLVNFRGLNSGVGTSYSDNLILDIRNEYNFKGRVISSFFKIPLINKIYNDQLKITKSHIDLMLKMQSICYSNNKRTKFLTKKYSFKNTESFGCIQNTRINKKTYSTKYLEIANRVDNIQKKIDFKKINSFLEIGGGFGANIHFIVNNFPNIKKIIYLDIVPNIYVGTEYLKKHFGKCVIDYLKINNKNKINFEKNEKLEIICIPPWKIENLDEQIDHFHNSCSFVEMPNDVIKNYLIYIKKLKIKSASLITYDDFDKSTISPTILGKLFNKNAKYETKPTLLKELGNFEYYFYKKF